LADRQQFSSKFTTILTMIGVVISRKDAPDIVAEIYSALQKV
jgi:hypothetical protein